MRARIVSGHLTESGQFCAENAKVSIFRNKSAENANLRYWEKIAEYDQRDMQHKHQQLSPSTSDLSHTNYQQTPYLPHQHTTSYNQDAQYSLEFALLRCYR